MPQDPQEFAAFLFCACLQVLIYGGGGKMLKKDDKALSENPVFAYGYLFR